MQDPMAAQFDRTPTRAAPRCEAKADDKVESAAVAADEVASVSSDSSDDADGGARMWDAAQRHADLVRHPDETYDALCNHGRDMRTAAGVMPPCGVLRIVMLTRCALVMNPCIRQLLLKIPWNIIQHFPSLAFGRTRLTLLVDIRVQGFLTRLLGFAGAAPCGHGGAARRGGAGLRRQV